MAPFRTAPRVLRFVLATAASLTLALWNAFAATSETVAAKPRIIVLTDIGEGEPDDEQSLIRLMVYANELEIEGLIANTSAWQRRAVHPELIRGIVEAYGEVRASLLVHAPGFPTAESLLKTIRSGQVAVGMEGVGDGKSTGASELIIDRVDRPDPRPVWILAWGGSTDLAQALWDVKQRRSPADVQRFAAKLRVYDIAGQDDTGAWITHTFPEVKWIRNARQFFGISRRFDGSKRFVEARGGNEAVMEHAWIDRHIRSHGPLGALYRNARYKYEGDTPAFLHLLPNGLGDPEQVHFGSWGGRFTEKRRRNTASAVPRVVTQHKYHDYWMHTDETDAWAYEGVSYQNEFAPLFRWREAFQHDFAARMDWTVMSRFADANHNPVAAIDGDASRNVVYRIAQPGETVRFSAARSTDPDGDSLSYEWFHYREPGTFPGEILIADPAARQIAIDAPRVATPQTAHIVLTVRDDGEPALYSYKRVVLTLTPEQRAPVKWPGNTAR